MERSCAPERPTARANRRALEVVRQSGLDLMNEQIEFAIRICFDDPLPADRVCDAHRQVVLGDRLALSAGKHLADVLIEVEVDHECAYPSFSIPMNICGTPFEFIGSTPMYSPPPLMRRRLAVSQLPSARMFRLRASNCSGVIAAS